MDWPAQLAAAVGVAGMPLRDALYKWILRTIETQAFRRLDDLHIDELATTYRPRHTWPGAVRDIAYEIHGLRNEIPVEYTASIGMPLISCAGRMGVTFHTVAEVADELTDTPPSIYVFPKGEEPWIRRPDDAVPVSPDVLSMKTDGLRCILFEYREEYEDEYRRSLWVLVDGP